MNLKVSVALCTCNGERYVGEQLASIASQTRPPDEVVVCDDASGDGTVDVVVDVCRRFGLHLRLRRNPANLGIGRNFSQALDVAGGDVIFLCDQDDVWRPERIQRMTDPFAADPGVSLVYSNGWITGPALEPTGHTLFSRNPGKDLHGGDERDIGSMIRNGRSPGIKGSAMAIRRCVRDLAGPVPARVAHDSWIAFWGYAGGRVVAIDDCLYSYRRHDDTGGKSSTNRLIDGLAAPPARSRLELIEEKLWFAEAVIERFACIERSGEDPEERTARYDELHHSAIAARRLLATRRSVLSADGLPTRVVRTLTGVVRRDYRTVGGVAPFLRLIKQDLLP